MSDSTGNSSHPLVHLIGSKVSLDAEVQEDCDIKWKNGIIVCAFETGTGIGVHIANPESGEVLEAMTLDCCILSAETLRLLQHVNLLAIRGAELVMAQLGDLTGGA